MSGQDFWAIPEASWSIEPDGAAVGAARRRAVDEVRTWCPELTEDVADTIRRVVTELVTNAIRHAGSAGEISLDLWLTPRKNLALVVTDSSPIPPIPRAPYEDGTAGRGLAVVEAETISWHWRPKRAGKEVRATIALPGSETRPQPSADTLTARVRQAAPRPAVHTIPARQTVLSAA